MKHHILIIEDDPKITATIKLYLEREGYRIAVADTGQEGLEKALAERTSLVILDLMLPKMSGLEVCRALKAESDPLIIMLTAMVTEDDKLRGLDLGADDYMTKPFSPRELVARVRAVLRRGAASKLAPAEIRFDELTVNFEKHEIRVKEKPISLTPSEFKLLEVLMRSPDRLFTRQELVERIFGYNYEGFDRTIDVHVMNLRKKIETDRLQPRFIVTVFGVGYKFSGGNYVS